MSMFSSSPAIISRPVSEPVPCRIPPVLIDAVLSALIVIHASTWYWSGGPLLAYGLSAARAFAVVAAPTTLKPTISAPPPLTNDLRENSFEVPRPSTSVLSLLAILPLQLHRLRCRRRGAAGPHPRRVTERRYACCPMAARPREQRPTVDARSRSCARRCPRGRLPRGLCRRRSRSCRPRRPSRG